VSKTAWWKDPARWLFVAGIIVFGSASSFYPFPGESTQMILQHTGVSPFRPASSVLWGSVASILSALPFLTLAATLNGFSILCAALSMALLFRILHDSRLDSDYDDLSPRFRTMLGLTSSLYLMASMPIWLFASRAHPAAFHLLMFLGAVRLIQQFGRTPSIKRLVVIGFLYGLGTVESSLFVAGSVALFPLMVFHLWRAGYLQWRPLAIGAAALLLAFLLYFIPAVLYARLPAAEWAGIGGPFHMYWILITASPRMVMGLLRQTGWLLMVIVSFLPWIGSLWARSYKPLSENSFGIMLASLLMVLVGGAMLFLPGIYPDKMAWYTRGFLLPPLLIATSFGIGAVFWCAFIKGFIRRKGRSILYRAGPDRLRAEIVITGLVLALIATALALNYTHVRPRGNALRYRIARHMVEPLSDGNLVITGIVLADELQVAAADAGKKISFIHVGEMLRSIQRGRMDSLMGSDRLLSLMTVSRKAMLREWLAAEPGLADRLVLQVDTEAWQAIGRVPVSDRGLYYGVERESAPDPETLFAAQQPLWDLLREELPVKGVASDDYEYRVRMLLAFYHSRAINDTGVLMAFLEKPDLAETCYRVALELQPSNTSALTNLSVMLHQREETNSSLLERLVQSMYAQREAGLQRMIEGSGMLRGREGLEIMQSVWASIAALPPEEERIRLAEAAIDEVEVDSPPSDGEPDALAGDQEIPIDPEAQALFDEMLEALRADELETATTLGHTLTRRFPQYDVPWILLGTLAYQQGDMETVDASIARMRERGARWDPLLEIAATRDIRKGQLDSARELYEFILAKEPLHVPAMEGLLRIDMGGGGTQRSIFLMRMLLDIDSGNYWANLVLGQRHALDEEYAKAASAYRAAAQRAPTPLAHQRLAYALHKAERHEEALEPIRESLREMEGDPVSWHIYGLIVEAQEDVAEAETAYRRALDLEPRMQENVLKLAELLHGQGRSEEARALLQRAHDDGLRFAPELRLRAERILEPGSRF